jgi:YD repeat-containing protein
VARTVLAASSIFALCAPAFAAEKVVFKYDALGRLVQVNRTGDVNNGVASRYCYDKSDNRKKVTISGAPSGPAPGPVPAECVQ